MSRTEVALNKLNDRMKAQVKFFKTHYGKDFAKSEKILGYLYGLEDAGFITEVDRRVIYCYITLGRGKE